MNKIIPLIIGLYCIQAHCVTKADNLHISFLATTPVIDGKLDSALQNLPVCTFLITDPDGKTGNVPASTFRIGYGTDFLYICTETESDSLICRDRGYQNGDGMIVVIAKPLPRNEPSREFYVLGFTAQPDSISNWQKKFVWYRNVDLAMTRLKEARFAADCENHKVIMECLIPWKEVYPYHPWLSDSIGLNLAVVKARGKEDLVWYYLTEDNNIQSEQHPRKYERVYFDTPGMKKETQSYAVLSANHCNEGGNLKIRIATAPSAGSKRTIRIATYSGDHEWLSGFSAEPAETQGVSITEKEIGCNALPAGGYQVEWSQLNGSSSGTLWFTVLPQLTIEGLLKKLEERKTSLSEGSYATIRLMITDAGEGLKNLKIYETANTQRSQVEKISRLINSPEDIIAGQHGIFRRGFLSSVDTTYRPYSVSVPGNYDPSEKYPLMVFLHGSGQDDRGILERLPDYGTEMIMIAPNGRGTSNCYVTDHAQDDIEEAIKDILKNYSIDPSRIILAGFSMGGYGVYATFRTNPARYRALAVFSGGPSIGVKWISPDEPDFLKDQYLAPFTGKKIFIFHGSKDFNLPVADTRQLVEKLKAHNADVTYIEEPVGHESPGESTLVRFREWLKDVNK